MSNILIISTSLRNNSNSDGLCEAFKRGAEENGNSVEKITLRDKTINFCKGCLACQTTQKCVIKDDAAPIVAKMKEADIIVFGTPVYYYDMCGQMKTLLDRANPLFPSDYKFRDIYLLASCADEEAAAVDGTVTGLSGWVACFEKASLRGVVCATGTNKPGEVKSSPALDEAYKLGKSI